VTTYVALLRGVNVGGNKLVAMADLRHLLDELGFASPRSLLQSGNLIFNSAARPAAGLERLLDTEAEKRLGLKTTFFVRTAKAWSAIIARNPFPDEARRDPGHLLVLCLRAAPAAGAVKALAAAITGREVVRSDGKEAYIVYPDGIGRSRLTSALLDKTLGRGTARNWNTVLKLGALTQDMP
jgi:uncharacterized protein (DUF1697 family)